MAKPKTVADLRADLYADEVDLPLKTFMYTTDQIAFMLDINHKSFVDRYMYFAGREARRRDPKHMLAINIAGVNDKPEWRVTEAELIRWCQKRNVTFYVSRRVKGR